MPTLKQIQEKVKRLQAQAEALIAKQGKTVLADIRKLMDDHGLTTADIEAHAATKKRAGRPAGGASAKVAKGKAATRSTEATASTSAKGKLPPKYRDPKTGATWSGHARPPAWIAKVRDRTKFLIDGASGAVSANGVSKAKTALNKTSAAAGAVARKGQGKAALPAKYRDPKSRRNVEWTRSRPPAWLAAVERPHEVPRRWGRGCSRKRRRCEEGRSQCQELSPRRLAQRKGGDCKEVFRKDRSEESAGFFGEKRCWQESSEASSEEGCEKQRGKPQDSRREKGGHCRLMPRLLPRRRRHQRL